MTLTYYLVKETSNAETVAFKSLTIQREKLWQYCYVGYEQS